MSHVNNFIAGNLKFPASYSLCYHKMSWLKPKSVENFTGMESEEPFGDEMPNCDICGTVFKSYLDIDVLDVDSQTETAASSENSGPKSTENEQLEVLYKHTICTGVSQWCRSLVMPVKVEISINTVELEVKYLYDHLNTAAISFCTYQFGATTSFNFNITTNHRPQKWDGCTTKYWRLAHGQNYKKIAILTNIFP